jgi:hypothetical protein
MKSTRLSYCASEAEAEKFKGQMMEAEHYDQVFSPGSSLEILKPDGQILIQIHRGAVTSNRAQSALPLMRRAKEPVTNRGTAAGVQGGNATYKSKVAGGYKTNTNRLPDKLARGLGSSSAVGYYDRYARIPFCRVCRHTEENPGMWKGFVPLVGVADQAFKAGHPEAYSRQKKLADLTNPAWVIGSSAFTTVTINKDFRTAAHKDAGDFTGGFGVMACITTGRVKGGLLVFPRYRVAVEIKSCDIVLFDVHEWHGNTALEKVGASERFTCVFYYRQNVSRCGSPAEEIARSRVCRDLKKLYCAEEIAVGDARIKLAMEN